MDEEPRSHEAPMANMTAETDELGLASHSHETRTSCNVGLNQKQAPDVRGDYGNPLTTAPASESKEQIDEDKNTGKKSFNDLPRKQAAMLEAYEKLVDEEAAIEIRTGQPSEKPSDKTRLVVVKQEIKRIDKALEQDQVFNEAHTAEEAEALQNAMGSPVEALRVNSIRKRATSTRKVAISAAKKRKGPSQATGGPSKKAKLQKAQKNKAKADDAVGRYHFDQLSGKGSAATTSRKLIKVRTALRGFGKVKTEDLKKLQAAVDMIESDDKDAKESINIDFRFMIDKAKAFGKLCTLKQLRGDESSDEVRQIDDYEWEIEGMASKLRHHQLIAAGFMIDVERKGDYSGGLLFDYMGYGKTVESLALIVGNPASKATKGSSVATTLVVVPTAAAPQWVDEIRLHCPGLRRSLWAKAVDMDVLTSSDVLVITYAQLMVLHKEALGIKKREKRKGRKEDKKNLQPALNHPLFHTEFHRIILDEMHEIKGYPNATCDAVMALKSKYRWGMTGTPTPNGLEELYPYLNFIRHPKITTMRDFKKTYVGGRVRGAIHEKVRLEKLRELLFPVMIMRTPSHSLFGATLLKLPHGHALPPIRVEFSPEERIIYNYIEKNIQKHIEKKAAGKGSKAGRNMVNESFVRHRQCVTSPLLLEKLAMEGFWCPDDVFSMKLEAQNARCQTTPFIDQIERWILKSNLHRASTTPEKDIEDARRVLASGTCPGNSCEKTIKQLIEPQKTECGHVWCKACLENQIKWEKVVRDKETPECNRCHKPLGQASPFPITEPGEETARPMDQGPTLQKKLGEDYKGRKLRGSNFLSLPDQDPTVKVPRSAKVNAVISQIEAWQKEAKEDKIIVFIQWIELNIILGRILQEEGIEFLYYAATTEMKEKDRTDAIATFKQDPKVKVLICSLRCGGQALNLTCANRTIMVDLWWNHSVEAQALARVFRMGQKKETYSVRIIVEKSVDERVFALQESKLELLQNSFQEFEAEDHLDIETKAQLIKWRSDGQKRTRGEDDTAEEDTNNDEYDEEESDDEDVGDEEPDGDYNPKSR